MSNINFNTIKNKSFLLSTKEDNAYQLNFFIPVVTVYGKTLEQGQVNNNNLFDFVCNCNWMSYLVVL